MWASSLASHKKTHEKRDVHVHVYDTNDDVTSVIGSEQSDEATLEQSGWIPEVKEGKRFGQSIRLPAERVRKEFHL